MRLFKNLEEDLEEKYEVANCLWHGAGQDLEEAESLVSCSLYKVSVFIQLVKGSYSFPCPLWETPPWILPSYIKPNSLCFQKGSWILLPCRDYFRVVLMDVA